MPPLPLERTVFPEDLFVGRTNGQWAGRAWWVLHTKPRQEKSLARDLLDAGVSFYLPLVSRRAIVRGRVLDSHIPLFTSYLFLLGDQDARLKALTTKRVVRSLEFAGQETLWHDLSQVNRLITTGAPITLEDRLAPGDPVRITGGALAGLEGKFVHRASGHRFVVQVDFIQKGASVVLEDFQLSAIEDIGAPAGTERTGSDHGKCLATS